MTLNEFSILSTRSFRRIESAPMNRRGLRLVRPLVRFATRSPAPLFDFRCNPWRFAFGRVLA